MITTYGIFLINENNELLITHPTNGRYTSWSIPKGREEGNETPIETIIIELYEETNIKLENIKDYITLPISEYKRKDYIVFYIE